MRAAPPHRFALHRHRRGSCAPLLLIASLCIVTGAAHRAAPPHRFALHRHRRGPSAPLLLIASLCIVTGAAHQRRSSSSLRSASSPARPISAALPRKRVEVPPAAQRRGGVPPPHRFALHRHRRGPSAPLLLIASLCIVAGAAHQLTRPLAYDRAASTIAENNRRSSKLSSGCHCTARTKPFPGRSSASTTPSASHALTIRPSPSSATA